MNADGSGVKRLTNGPVPTAAFSWDGKQVVFRGRMLGAGAELDDIAGCSRKAVASDVARALRHGPRRINLRQVASLAAPIRALLASRRQAPDLRLEQSGSRGPNFDIY